MTVAPISLVALILPTPNPLTPTFHPPTHPPADKYYVRFNHYWLFFAYLYLYIFNIWIVTGVGLLDTFPYDAMKLDDENVSIRVIFA